ncbi:MAG: hypothetical protein WCD70_06405 [Alphaproteobacteria bacterium]
MTKNPKDPMHQRVILGTNAGGAAAVERARQTSTPLVVWRDGRVREVSPDDPSLRRNGVQKNDATKRT